MIGNEKEKLKINMKKKINKRIFLIVSAGVILISLAVSAVLILSNAKHIERIIDYGTIMRGVSLNGIDLSGKTLEQAKAVTADIPENLLSKAEFILEVKGDIYTYTADDFNVSTDYQDIIKKAFSYGHFGSYDERKKAVDTAKNEGANFSVSLCVDEKELKSAFAKLKQILDKPPQDAAAAFMPWGYTKDGKEYKPDVKAMADAHADGKEYDEDIELVRIDVDDMPSSLRYQYWETKKYIDDFTLKDANIARFLYTPEAAGFNVDMDAIYDEIMAQVQSGDFSKITVPVEPAEADITLEDVINDTQLIVSWTSSYESHDKHDRVWNVSRMSSFINGEDIQPGEEWSVNDTAGPRDAKTAKIIGWKKAAGLYQGSTTQQYGGGVCQLGSTTYNAALRADLTIVEHWHHSDASGYIPKGLDATLDSGGKDLVLRNDGTAPVYLVSYVDPKKQTVTVEVYGRLPYSEKFKQYVIYDYTSDNKGKPYGMGRVKTIKATQTPTGDVLSPENPIIVFSSPKAGRKVEVFKLVYALDGTELENKLFRVSDYKPINGYTYIYPPNLMPASTPTPPTPTPPTPTPPAPTTPESTPTTPASTPTMPESTPTTPVS